MTTGVSEVNGVVVNVRVLVNALRIPEVGYNGIWTQKATDIWREVAGAEIEDSAVRVTSPPLPRESTWIPAVAYSNASV